MSKLFISHSSPDHGIAKALEEAIEFTLDGGKTQIDVCYSSSATQGPYGGEEWREWIERVLLDAKTVLVVFSRISINRHWPIWEAAAARGIILSRSQLNKNEQIFPKIIALTYGITKDECPDPFQKEQIFSGEKPDEIKEVFRQVIQNHAIEDQLQAGENLPVALKEYMKKVQEILLGSTSLVNESTVQDWLARLDELASNQRWSELPNFQYWMDIAFGLKDGHSQSQIDIRLHRRLGDYYLGRKKYKLAIEQFRLARISSPRDVYILTRLSESLIKKILEENKSPNSENQELEDLLQRIKTLDPEVIYQNPDSAALEAKYERKIKNNLEKAIHIYKNSFERNPNSYYLLDVLGQTYIDNDQLSKAKQVYVKALKILEQLSDHSIWSLATQSTANLVLGNYEATEASLLEIKSLKPPASIDQINSVREGILDLCRALPIHTSTKEKLVDTLKV